VTLGVSFATPMAAAPWCAVNSSGRADCSYQTFAECQEDVSRLGGSCQPNRAEPPGSPEVNDSGAATDSGTVPPPPGMTDTIPPPPGMGGAMPPLPGMGSSAPASASAWCANESGGGLNCGFQTYQECMRAVSGVGGFCSPR